MLRNLLTAYDDQASTPPETNGSVTKGGSHYDWMGPIAPQGDTPVGGRPIRMVDPTGPQTGSHNPHA